MHGARKILLISDQDVLTTLMEEQFQSQDEFELCHAQTLALAKEVLDGNAHLELAIVNATGLMSPDEAVRLIRSVKFASPLLFLLRQGQVLSASTDQPVDILYKPFRFTSLLTKARTLVRAHEQSDASIVPIGPYTFHPVERVLRQAGGEDVKLTDKEASILKYLHRAKGAPVSREQMLDEVWGYNSGVTTHTLETHVYRLRQKIEPEAGEQSILMTEAGGYRLALPPDSSSNE